MINSTIEIEWPNGNSSIAEDGQDWLQTANNQGVVIPTGCLSGSCGACEIEVNGKVIRACISTIEKSDTGKLKVELYCDPYW